MAWPIPQFSRSEVNRAGDVLRTGEGRKLAWATKVLGNWRSCHGYPVNTFQATLRAKLKRAGEDAIVAQRMKRTPSIVAKLRRFEKMQLVRMQDIGGLRAVTKDLRSVRLLEADYRQSQFDHELVNSKDYIDRPKSSGYRGVHLVYRYKNNLAPNYDGLLLELQLRTRHQHTWATAVETMGTFLGQALKSSEGEKEWLKFFSLAGSAFAHLEGTNPVPGYEGLTKQDSYRRTVREAERLRVHERLSGFTVAMDAISSDRNPGSYRLIELDLEERKVKVTTYPRKLLEAASDAYTALEQQISDGANLQAVLVATGPIDTLRRAYPNYFLDTQDFLKQLQQMKRSVKKR